MIERILGVALAAVALLGLGSCADQGGGGPLGVDALVVVQETNLNACSEPYVVERTIIRACDGDKRTILLCSEGPLCEGQIDDLLAPHVACEEERTLYTGTTDVVCEAE